MNKPTPIELDHINGDSTDNSLSNLRLLCPNCHTQTKTYKGKNKSKGRFKRIRMDYLIKDGAGGQIRTDD